MGRIRGIARASDILWIGAVALALLVVSLQLMATAEASLRYWYLLSVPIILAAFRFGMRGALIASGASALVFIVVFRSALSGFQEVTSLLGDLIRASSSPEEARRLAFELADVLAADPRAMFPHSAAGMLLIILGGSLLGAAVDRRNRTKALLERVIERLGRYFSPALVQYVTTQDHEAVAESARKDITVLIASLRDFAALYERMEPGETVRLLNEYLEAMTEEVFRESGTLDRYIGHGLVAFFGAPVQYPDHAARAFRAALTMQQRSTELQTLWLDRGWQATGMGIGICTGAATVGNIGSVSRMEYSAVGSTVNVAARLCADAGEGQILTTRKTFRHVQHFAGATEREATVVEGFTQPIETVEITGARIAPEAEGDGGGGLRLTEIISTVVNDPAYRAAVLSSPKEASTVYGLTGEEQDLAQQVAMLCGYPIFQGVPAEEIAALVVPSSTEQYAEGTLIIRQGAAGQTFYMILHGDVAIMALDEAGRERHIASLARGDYFGEMALLFDTPRTATVRSNSPSRLLVLRQQDFYRVLDRAPTLRSRIEATARARLSLLPYDLRGAQTDRSS